MLNRTVFGFTGGAVSYLVFAAAAFVLIQMAGYIPADAPSPWATVAIPPFRVPRVVSNAFWGGLWGALLCVALPRMQGAAYWISWTAIGSVALSLVSLFVVPPLKGLPIGPLTPRGLVVQFTLAATWGLGVAIVLRLLGGTRAPRPAGALQS